MSAIGSRNAQESTVDIPIGFNPDLVDTYQVSTLLEEFRKSARNTLDIEICRLHACLSDTVNNIPCSCSIGSTCTASLIQAISDGLHLEPWREEIGKRG